MLWSLVDGRCVSRVQVDWISFGRFLKKLSENSMRSAASCLTKLWTAIGTRLFLDVWGCFRLFGSYLLSFAMDI